MYFGLINRQTVEPTSDQTSSTHIICSGSFACRITISVEVAKWITVFMRKLYYCRVFIVRRLLQWNMHVHCFCFLFVFLSVSLFFDVFCFHYHCPFKTIVCFSVELSPFQHFLEEYCISYKWECSVLKLNPFQTVWKRHAFIPLGLELSSVLLTDICCWVRHDSLGESQLNVHMTFYETVN